MRARRQTTLEDMLIGNRLAFAWNYGPDPVPPTQPMPPRGNGKPIWSRPTSSLDSDLPVPPPPPPPSSRSTAALIIGILCAVLVVALAGGGFVLAQHGAFLAHAAPTVTAPAQATPQAAATAADSPTAAPTSAAQGVVPTPADGYQTYTASAQGWACNYPTTAQVGQGNVTVQGVSVPTTAFDFAPGASLTVYAIPQAVTAAQPQEIFDDLVATVGATHVAIVEQPTSVVVGANTWMRVTITATINGQAMQARIYYAPYGSGALAISASAPAASFGDADAQDFAPLLQTFTLVG